MVRRRLIGVFVGGVPLRIGHHCLYNAGEYDDTRLGVVLEMFYGKDDMMDEFVILQVQNKPITTYMGHYCFFSDAPQIPTEMVLWSKLTWKCKTFKMQGGGNMALPYVSCTSVELVEFQ